MIPSVSGRRAREFAGAVELYGCRNRIVIRLEIGDFAAAQNLCRQARAEAEQLMEIAPGGVDFERHRHNACEILRLEGMIAAAALNCLREEEVTVSDCV